MARFGVAAGVIPSPSSLKLAKANTIPSLISASLNFIVFTYMAEHV